MKKMILITMGLVLSTLTNINAQSAAKTSGVEYWSLGPILGFGGSWVNNMDNQNFKPSGELGLGIIYSRHEHWGLGADVTASAEGYSSEYLWNGVSYTSEVTPVYLRFTPKVYYFFMDYGDKVRPKIYLGPSVAYKLGEGQDINAPALANGDLPRILNPTGEVFDNMDIGVKVGAGANIQLARSLWLNTDLGYYQGLMDATDMDNKNSNLRLNLGLMFGL
jgi:hypothetical protein